MNPRFQHTFCDEDQMRVLKLWSKKTYGKTREKGIMRLARARFKTLAWRIPDLLSSCHRGKKGGAVTQDALEGFFI